MVAEFAARDYCRAIVSNREIGSADPLPCDIRAGQGVCRYYLLGEFNRIVEILAEILLACRAGRAIGELGAHPLLAAFIVCAVVPDHRFRGARGNAAADIEITPFRLVLGYLKLDDLGAGLVADNEMPFVGGMGLHGCKAKNGTYESSIETNLGGHEIPQVEKPLIPSL